MQSSPVLCNKFNELFQQYQGQILVIPGTMAKQHTSKLLKKLDSRLRGNDKIVDFM